MMFMFFAAAVAGDASHWPLSRDVYDTCAEVVAKDLESSGEPADTIAGVALMKCEPALEPAYNDYIAWFRQQPEVASFEAEGRNYVNYNEVKPQILEKFRSNAREKAVAAVVEIRAAKAAKKKNND
jgi:hypothetical protein